MRNRHIAVRNALRVMRAQGMDWRKYPYRYHRLLSTRVPCSCYMCGNPRRHFGAKTRQEIRADDDMADQMKDAVGTPISRAEALRVSKETIARAEQERSDEIVTKILHDRADAWRRLADL